MEWVKPDAGCDRRARGETKNNPAEHERAERGQRQPVDGPPPFTESRAFDARSHGSPLSRRSPDSTMVSKGLRLLSPRLPTCDADCAVTSAIEGSAIEGTVIAPAEPPVDQSRH